MSDDRKVANLELARKGVPDDLARAIAEMRDRLPALIEHQKLLAKMQRAAYLSYIEVGFAHRDALELCKIIPANR